MWSVFFIETIRAYDHQPRDNLVEGGTLRPLPL
jgi:hypothetical protein